MSALLSAELLKLRTTRTFVAMASAALGLSLLLVVLVTTLDERPDPGDVLAIDGTQLFILLLGAIGITGEWRHRTITSSLLAAPDRVRFLVSKLLAYAAAGVVLSLVVTLAVAVVSALILSSRSLDAPSLAEVVKALWRNAVAAALVGALGVAVGSVIRNQAGALVTLLALGFVVEPVVIGVANDVGKFLPIAGAASAINRAGDDTDLLGRGAAILVELGWVALIAGIGALLLRKRDL